MQSFITETIQKITKQHQNFNDVVIILPSQRAKVFVREALKNEIELGFLPEIYNIEEFVSEISGIDKAESIELLFHLYTIYKNEESNPDSFDKFSGWAFTVIQDFNEIDQHLVDTHDIFNYVRDIQRLREWSVKGEFKETTLIKNHFNFLKKLEIYYDKFYTELVEKKIGYQGVSYREAVKNTPNYLENNQHKYFHIVGFNALNLAEEKIFQEMLSCGNTSIYWDIDKTFLESDHQAGKFIRKYQKEWSYYDKNKIETSDYFSKEKQIEIIGSSKNITQIKYTGQLLSKFDNTDNTALILADESLLPITLNSLPENIRNINITMGYPLKDIPTTHLISSIFQLFLTQKKLNKTVDNSFYYKTVFSFIKQPPIHKLISLVDDKIVNTFVSDISRDNMIFVNKEYIEVCFKDFSKKLKPFLNIFEPFKDINEFIQRVLLLINNLKEDVNPLEKEFLYRYNLIFTQLLNLQEQFGYFTDLKTLSQFFNQLISVENLSFKGEPLKGLQLMGMLETRVLDFKNIILTSVNEGILPANSQQDSFIPFDVKQEFNLPTYQEKDAIYAYHFFRLLQRSENIYLIYNTENDSFGKGEKSRFITQLELLKKNMKTKIVSPKLNSEIQKERIIEKNDDIIEKLKFLAKKGFSPSSLTTYLYNPVKFYQQKILKIKQVDELEETVAMNTVGTVVHETLDSLYQPFIGKFISSEDIKEMQTKITATIEHNFSIYFLNGDITKGKNRLAYEVAVRYVSNFLNQELELLTDKSNTLKIVATEQSMKAEIKLDNLDFPINIKGTVDRVDELNGVLRIIDYKTGVVTASNLRTSHFDEINDYKYHKAIQVLLYTYMFTSEKGFPDKEINAGIISFKNLKSGFLALNFAEGRKVDNSITKERIDEFIEYFKGLLYEIYNKDIPFREPLDLPY